MRKMASIIMFGLLILAVFANQGKGIVFTENARIAFDDLSYEGENIVVDGCTLTINGKHSFSSLELRNAAVVTHSPAPNGEPGHWIDLHITGDVNVPAGCAISADERGYGAGKGPGINIRSLGVGGSAHGGRGGRYGGYSGLVYGSATEPNDFGSGGRDNSYLQVPIDGSCGGGLIKLSVKGLLTVNGTISAGGGQGDILKIGFLGSDKYGCDGSGGSVFIEVGMLAGGGTISVNGGAQNYGGGGGRVAIHYQEKDGFLGMVNAKGATGVDYPGEDGSVYWRDVATPTRVIYVDDDAYGVNDGASWATACRYLQDALHLAQLGDEIRIGQGVYTPDRGSDIWPGDQHTAFELVNDVVCIGGYGGLGAADPNDRDAAAYPTILTGDLRGNDNPNTTDPERLLADPNRDDNSVRILYTENASYMTVINGCMIMGGNNRTEGGAGMWIGSVATPKIVNCVFRGNSAAGDGGALLNFGSPTISTCQFMSNWSDSNGGGLYTTHKLALTKCRFASNFAGAKGGGLYTDAGASAVDCEFVNNVAHAEGGGVYTTGGPVEIQDSLFQENQSVTSAGGGMYSIRANVDIARCAFKQNVAGGGGYGGALRCGYGEATVSLCEFSGNSALSGGVLRLVTAKAAFSNSIMSGNVADKGGAIYSTDSEVTISNCTLAGNLASEGTTLACDSNEQKSPSRISFLSCIMWNGSGEILNNDQSTLWIGYSDVFGGWDWPGIDNLNVDPLFVDPGYWGHVNDVSQTVAADDPNAIWIAGDYHLLTESLCIDTGDPDYVSDPNQVTTDIYGGVRLIGERVDIGADEYDPNEFAILEEN